MRDFLRQVSECFRNENKYCESLNRNINSSNIH